LEGTWDGTQVPITFHFIVFKNFVVDLTFSDGNMIQDGTVAKSKLKPELQAEIDSKATQTDLQNIDNKIGVLSNLNTNDKSNLVNAFNEHSADTVSHITSAERAKWNGADSKAQDLEILYWMGAI